MSFLKWSLDVGQSKDGLDGIIVGHSETPSLFSYFMKYAPMLRSIINEESKNSI